MPNECQHKRVNRQNNVGYDVDEEGEEYQHLETCLDCGAERIVTDHTEHGMRVGKWVPKESVHS